MIESGVGKTRSAKVMATVIGMESTPSHVARPGRRRAPVSRFVRAALAGEWRAATEIATDFMTEKGSRATVITDLFQGAQVLIGNRWHVGQATAADEYRVAEAISAAMQSLPAAPRVHSFTTRARALLATVWPERHDLGLRLVSEAFDDDGWDVDLAPGIEAVELVNRASETAADLVGISATFVTGQARGQLGAVVRSLHSFGVPVIVGGGAFVRAPRLAHEVGVDATAADARAAVILARRLHVARRPLWSSRAQASGA